MPSKHDVNIQSSSHCSLTEPKSYLKVLCKLIMNTKKCNRLYSEEVLSSVKTHHQNRQTNAGMTCGLWWQWQTMFRLDFQIHACFWQSHGKSMVCVEVGQLCGRMYSGKEEFFTRRSVIVNIIYKNALADKWKYITSTYKNQRVINSKSFDAAH